MEAAGEATDINVVRHPAGLLIAISGLPGTGKSSIARRLADQYAAMYLRIDTIEQALIRAGMVAEKMGPEGYGIAYAVAEENLRLGRTVIADAVNPLAITRQAWREVAARARVQLVEVEICCSDIAEHRHRVETRRADIDGHILPTWQDVLARVYEPWQDERIIIDTARHDPSACVDMLDQCVQKALQGR